MKMKQVIRFRAKKIIDGKWVYGVPVYSVNGKCYMIHGATEDAVNSANEVDFIYSDVNPDTVGQFMGLKDKNGVEIYEGDLVELHGCLYKIIWDDGKFVALNCSETADEEPRDLYDGGHFARVVGNIHDNPESVEKKAEGYKGVALFGYPYLFQNGDLGFYEEMSKLGLSRGDIILGGLPNKCILANKREYLLTDYNKEQDFCEQFKLKATYSVEDFIQGIKELKSEGGQQ